MIQQPSSSGNGMIIVSVIVFQMSSAGGTTASDM